MVKQFTRISIEQELKEELMTDGLEEYKRQRNIPTDVKITYSNLIRRMLEYYLK